MHILFTMASRITLNRWCGFLVQTSTGKSFATQARIDTDVELDYYRSGGILPFLVKKIAAGE